MVAAGDLAEPAATMNQRWGRFAEHKLFATEVLDASMAVAALLLREIMNDHHTSFTREGCGCNFHVIKNDHCNTPPRTGNRPYLGE